MLPPLSGQVLDLGDKFKHSLRQMPASGIFMSPPTDLIPSSQLLSLLGLHGDWTPEPSTSCSSQERRR